MPVGALVSVPELQSEGLARIVEVRGGFTVLRFLISGAEKTHETGLVLRWCLLPGTRIATATGSGVITAKRMQRDATVGLLVYGAKIGDAPEALVREDAITAVPWTLDPVEQLATACFNDLRPVFAKAGSALPPEPWAAQTAAAREELMAWRDAAWSLTGGVVGMAAARIRPLPHQLLVAQRALADRQVRFLLADEVGLGKTIEAGLVIQSLLAMKPGLRALVIAPGALLSQWFLELHIRFGGQPWVMIDGERLATMTGNPWADAPFVLASSKAIEELDTKSALRLANSTWDVVVVDECHRMQPGGVLYKRVAMLSKRTPHVLLLSATPARQHPDAWLALASLLQPQQWRLEDIAAFTAALDARAAVDGRVIANRRRDLARLSAGGAPAIAPTTRSRERVPYKPDAAEQAVRAAMAAYRKALTVDEIPPRLAHWLLQLELALAAHPQVLDRLLAMRAAVAADPDEFIEYRMRCAKGETLAQVLRSDLSENEVNTHVAVSAACHCDPEREKAPLTALRTAVTAWARQKATARLAALIERLNAFWEEHPQEKVLVFTTHALAVPPLASALERAFGEQAVATFGAHQDTIEREESARRFQVDDRCPLLVCDPLGGEGRNFQFVSVVVHHDLPWSLAAVEQRVGRVDRIGRDGDIPSWIMAPADPTAVDGAWGELLDQAVGVFSGSSSGLEFISDAIETAALAGALADGGAGVRTAIPEAAKRVAAERAAREAEGAQTFASAAESYAAAVAATEAVATAPAPIGAVTRWIRGMGGDARREEEHPRPWRLRTRWLDEAVHGVFERDAALSHPHLAFLGIGNHLVDRLVADAAEATWARACAWRRPRGTVPAWNGVRAVYALSPSILPIATAGLRLEVLRRLFIVVPPTRITVCAHADSGEIATDPELVALLAPPFSSKAGDLGVSAGSNREAWTRPLLAGQPDKVTGWQDGVRRGAAAAQAHVDRNLATARAAARAALDAVLEPALTAAEAGAVASASRFGADHPEAKRARMEADDEAKQVAALRAALDGATYDLEAIAFIALV